MPRRVVIANIVFATTVAVLVLTARTPHAQETPRPAFRVSTELVVVDLLATGRSQQFVSDLQPADLQVFEDGTPQKIEFVRLVRHRGATTCPPRARRWNPEPGTWNPEPGTWNPEPGT